MQTEAKETKDYKVTDKAGDWVAGRRNPGVDKVMKLTEEQARYPLIHKHIELATPATLPPPTDPDTPAVPAPTTRPRK